MDGPHDEDETEPGNVPIVVFEGIVRESLGIWVEVQAQFTSYLLTEQIEDGAEYLSEEYKKFNFEPPLSLVIPVRHFSASVSWCDGSILLLVEDGVHD